jgi:KDO2-lipid IV(A) lauroyltransferase
MTHSRVAGTALAGAWGRAAGAATDNAVATSHLFAWRLARRLPEPAVRAVFARIAERTYRRDGPGVRCLRGNLARVRPDLDSEALDAVTRAGVHSYLRYWSETFRLPAWSRDDVVRRTRTVDEHLIREALARGHGVVAVLPHMANWDWAGAWACATGMPLVTVAERLRPERLFDEFVAYRASLGMRILPLTGSHQAFPELVAWVRSGGLVCLLADRDLARDGVEVTLCGAPARLPRGPAVLARRTGAPLVPVTLAYDGDCLEVTFHPEVPVAPGGQGTAVMMQQVADVFTVALRTNPQDWHMMQPVFLDEPAHPTTGSGSGPSAR